MGKKCIQCGAELENEAMFCDECGAPQTVEKGKSVGIQKESVELKSSGMAIVSCICGVISICTFGILFVPEILGIVFGIISLKTKNVKHGLDTAGLVLSIVAIIIFVLLMVIGLLLP